MLNDKELLWKVIMWGIVAIVMMAAAFQACEHFYAKTGIIADNPIEEAIEDVIKHETGVDLDMSPESKEENNG